MEETPIQTTTSAIPAKPNPYEDKSEQELEQMIAQTQEQIRTGQTQTTAQPPIGQAVPNQTTPSNPVLDGQVKIGQTPEQTSPNQAVQPPIKVETKPEMTFEQLQQKTGVPNADVLAKNYIEIQRELTRKSQELSRVRQETSVAPTAPTMPTPYSSEQGQAQPPVQPQATPAPQQIDYNQQFVEALSRDPLGTIAKVVDFVAGQKMQPFEQTQKEISLRNEIVRLQSSPNTSRTFSTPEVQDEIKKVISEDPNYFMADLPGRLSKAHEMALGRIAMRGMGANAGTPNPSAPNTAQAGYMEGRAVPTQPQAFNPETASLTDLELAIKRLQATL